MIRIVIVITLFALILACNNAETTNGSVVKSFKFESDTSSIKTERQILIDELKRLQAIFESNDKAKIADLFSFPISNDIVGIYIDDSAFNAQLNENQNMVTQSMFNRFYDDISESLQIDQINQLFINLNVDSLLVSNYLGYEFIIKIEPCYHFYWITVEKDLVKLTVGTNSNKDFKTKRVSEDEISENDSINCEHALWWNFKFDGKRLHFKEISGAG